jgi:hypothetical protein
LFSVDNPTLNRFYSLHYTFPFLLAGLSIFHIAALHQYGSTNPLGVNTQTSTVPFGMYFASKDLLGLLILLFAFACLVFFYPEMLGLIKAVFIFIKAQISAICWNDIIIKSAGNLDALLLINKYINYKHYNKGSSETKRTITHYDLTIIKPVNLTSNKFDYWFSGLVDGDGSFSFYNSGTVEFSITMITKDKPGPPATK